MLAGVEPDSGDNTVRTTVDAFHRARVGEGRAGLLRGSGETPGDLVHATGGKRDPLDGVHVRDDAEDREGVEGRQACIEGLKGEHSLQALVVEEAGDLRGEAAQRAEAAEAGQLEGSGGEVERRVEVAVDERPKFGVVEVA